MCLGAELGCRGSLETIAEGVASSVARKLVAILGVAIGMVALAVGAGPQTASNDVYHRIMLALATAAIVILVVPAGRSALRRN